MSGDGQRLGRVAVLRDISHLKELDELKSEFVSTVSHDLRSPLTFIRGYATMLPSTGELSDEQQAYVTKILKGVDQISDLVEDLLDLRRIESGAGFETQPCHIATLVSEAVDARRMRAAAKEIDLQLSTKIHDESGIPLTHLDPRALIVSGDAASLRQAVTNLVDNAIKYTPGGGQVRVRMSVARQEQDWRILIDVMDTGIGIAPEDQVRLFEKFYRIKRSDVPSVQGTGLGLSLVRSIIERHKGDVSVESELNQGSTFTIRLPLADPVPLRDMRRGEIGLPRVR
jgi:signal transduction histidine kinase